MTEELRQGLKPASLTPSQGFCLGGAMGTAGYSGASASIVPPGRTPLGHWENPEQGPGFCPSASGARGTLRARPREQHFRQYGCGFASAFGVQRPLSVMEIQWSVGMGCFEVSLEREGERIPEFGRQCWRRDQQAFVQRMNE